jgi:hypothetical protein
MKIPKPEKAIKNKRMKAYARIRPKIIQMFIEKGITRCELMLDGCLGDFALAPAHRHKRGWYYERPELLGDFFEVVLACVNCHDKIEFDKKLTEEMFIKIRDKRYGQTASK